MLKLLNSLIRRSKSPSQFVVPFVFRVQVDGLSHQQLRFRLFLALLQCQVILLFFVTLGLGRRNLFVLPVVFDIVGIEDLLHHLIDGIEDGVVIDFKVFEDGIEVGVGFEDVVVGASNAGEGTLKLLVCALLQKPEGVLFGKRWQFDIFDVLHPNQQNNTSQTNTNLIMAVLTGETQQNQRCSYRQSRDDHYSWSRGRMLSYSLSQLTTFAILLVNLEFQASDLRLDPLLLIFLSLYFFIGLVYLRFIASHYDIHRGGKSFKIFLFELSHVLFSDYYLAQLHCETLQILEVVSFAFKLLPQP